MRLTPLEPTHPTDGVGSYVATRLEAREGNYNAGYGDFHVATYKRDMGELNQWAIRIQADPRLIRSDEYRRVTDRISAKEDPNLLFRIQEIADRARDGVDQIIDPEPQHAKRAKRPKGPKHGAREHSGALAPDVGDQNDTDAVGVAIRLFALRVRQDFDLEARYQDFRGSISDVRGFVFSSKAPRQLLDQLIPIAKSVVQDLQQQYGTIYPVYSHGLQDVLVGFSQVPEEASMRPQIAGISVPMDANPSVVGSFRGADPHVVAAQLAQYAQSIGIRTQQVAPINGGDFTFVYTFQKGEFDKWAKIEDAAVHAGYEASPANTTSIRTLTAIHGGEAGGAVVVTYTQLGGVQGVQAQGDEDPTFDALIALVDWAHTANITVVEANPDTKTLYVEDSENEDFWSGADHVATAHGVYAEEAPTPRGSGLLAVSFVLSPERAHSGLLALSTDGMESEETRERSGYINSRLSSLEEQDSGVDLNPYPQRGSVQGYQDPRLQAIRKQREAAQIAAESNTTAIPMMLGMAETKTGCIPAMLSEMDAHATYAQPGFQYSPPTRWRLR